MSTEILRPNAAGDVTQLSGVVPHWAQVDEVTADEATTTVFNNSGPLGADVTLYDLYHLPAHSGSGTINSVKVYFRCKWDGGSYSGFAFSKLKTGGTEYTGSQQALTTSWVTKTSALYTTNPKTGVAWTWDDIDALQIGVQIRSYGEYNTQSITYCTQVYVEVNYTEAAAGRGCFSKF